MAADVVGYSRLMGANEVGTLTALKQHRAEMIDPAIAEHQGRIVKLTGDGMLVEFPSVVSAVECAAPVQREMRGRNADVPEDRRIEFRIGINLGDVIVEDDDIFGDGVNVAARLEGVAKPGGVAVSQLGARQYRQQARPHVRGHGRPAAQEHRIPGARLQCRDRRRAGAPRRRPRPKPAEADKPSIAVLPFNNMSGDPEQEFFSDGITEDIITDLRKISGLFVVGRNTSFTYKGKSVQLQQVAPSSGVKFLLEGSVRKAGQRVRVNAQLIDGTNGGHLWADRFDRDLTDIFAIQDEITQRSSSSSRSSCCPRKRRRSPRRRPPTSRPIIIISRAANSSTIRPRVLLRLARQMFAKAVEIDPTLRSRLCRHGDLRFPARELVSRCLDPDRRHSGDRGQGASRSIPILPEAHAARGEALSNSGRPDEAAGVLRTRAGSSIPTASTPISPIARYLRERRAISNKSAAAFRAGDSKSIPTIGRAPLLLESA